MASRNDFKLLLLLGFECERREEVIKLTLLKTHVF
jgi:hypothetical protein